MALSERSYSRVVSLLKVALPLAAVALLSTVFLVSRGQVSDPQIPYSQVDLKDIASREGITRPSFAGATQSGDMIAITADEATPDGSRSFAASGLKAQLDLVGGSTVKMSAARGVIDQGQSLTRLEGGVAFSSSLGYTLTTEGLSTAMKSLDVESLGPVSGTAPAGTLTAGHMSLHKAKTGTDSYLLFTDGVELVYDPRTTRE
ncbi:hypothetical protein KM176_08550 [Pseudooceanicola sp. CBS1P-1]|uniref:LPS export ABC transporter periplasmic protein LptC n=1 Tax=Pseudooceanicola albus TaxID=2692189 RepID=A0A6L7G271_9RHOB|nr:MULTISPECIES: hypothetical protein [Pseudooceanicola]MBT9383904.1 hypothetical protein [Pseudooceanicola endophyticus]MXN16683.1 hypothetical protein [Pseudooceanicola albus]